MDYKEQQNSIDIKENYIKYLDDRLLKSLLKDKSSDENILWATDMYSGRGFGFYPRDYITVEAITGRRGNVIKPRVEKSKKEQKERIKTKGEVFTPSWICNEMASGFDDWFGRKYVFNTPDGLTWHKTEEKITFPEGKTWKDYVRLRVLEITCGEAPFLASRYDTVTGEWIDVNCRVGLLDRKLRVINENTSTEDEWVKYAFEAYQSTYGFEWQGDSLLIARENLLFTFIDYFVDKFGNFPPNEYLLTLANILSWNIFQMDGQKYVIPYSCKPRMGGQLSIFDSQEINKCCGCESGDNGKHAGIYCKIKNWRRKTTFNFYDLMRGNKMKFDFVIGNPPYQQESGGTKIADDSIYHYFMDAAYEISDKVILITPSKFLFNNGNTPVAWNKKMLNDEHFKVLFYEPVASKIFPNVSFKGGVAIHYRDRNANFGSILQFTEFVELNSVLRKVLATKEDSLTTIIHNQNKFNLENLYSDCDGLKSVISSEGRERRMTSGCLKYECFHLQKEDDNDIQICGVINNKRERRYINRKYLEEPHPNIDKYKVIVPANNGSGALGEVISGPLVLEPHIGYTQTFIGIGAFDTLSECENVLKYIKTKFARTMLGILKVTHNGKREMWKYIPLQDFTERSDIDWSKTVHEIDLQLYKKYGLDDKEISFIETHVKEMD